MKLKPMKLTTWKCFILKYKGGREIKHEPYSMDISELHVPPYYGPWWTTFTQP